VLDPAQPRGREPTAGQPAPVRQSDERRLDADIGTAQQRVERRVPVFEVVRIAGDVDQGSQTPEGEKPVVTADIVAASVDRALLRYDRNGDEHYDVISAFIKSVRGSDVDAALHYLARMIEAGEDPRFIARRVIISAAEDIGMADPQALPIAVAAAEAVQMIGMPEGRIPLAEAVVYLATAPKSNASYNGINAAIADVKAGRIGRVPKHLRDAHYPGARRLGHGQGYRYAHDAPFGVAEQQYLPDELVGTRYYTPTGNGHEREVGPRLDRLRAVIEGRPMPAREKPTETPEKPTEPVEKPTETPVDAVSADTESEAGDASSTDAGSAKLPEA